MSPPPIASTPEPPYYAVIFTSTRSHEGRGYEAMAEKMIHLAAQQPGFLGVESVRGADGTGITVSYWDSEGAIANWRHHADHQVAQRLGRETWYADFALRIAKVERASRRVNPEAAG